MAVKWGGQVSQRARKYMARYLPTQCARGCGKYLTGNEPWVVGHIKSRKTHPELTLDVNNWQIECRECSDKSGQQTVIDNAARNALKAAGINPDSVFPHSGSSSSSPPLSSSLSQGQQSTIEVPEWLNWNKDELSKFDWMQPLLEVPEDSSPPLAMTPPHPEATGSYGAEAVEWIESTQNIELRWWQKLAIVRQLEHRADGSLCWRTIVESCPRRAGKSVRIRGMALWRMSHAQLIGEVQTIVHCGNELPICREIQRGAWRWSEAQGWQVFKANGKESIEADDGSRWLVRSQDGVYGWDAGLAVVDESWDVKPETITEGLEPAMLGRRWAQLHLTSTAHRRATSLMKQRISGALSDNNGKTLLMLWGAPGDADPADPAVWKAASPHWDENRRDMIADKYAAAVAGEIDPELDDPDPMQGFTAQYLNIWQLKGSRKQVGEPLTSDATWEALTADLPNDEPDCVAVEGWNGEGLSVAAAWRVGDTVTVSVQDFTDLASAAAYVATFTLRKPVVVGAALVADPVWQGVKVKPAKSTVGAAVTDLSRLLNDGVIRHDGEAHLTHQVLNVRTSPSADGLRIRSTGRSDAIKAAVFAIQDARMKSKGKPRILIAS